MESFAALTGKNSRHPDSRIWYRKQRRKSYSKMALTTETACEVSSSFPISGCSGIFTRPANWAGPRWCSPRLGGKQKLGVFASRSRFRPNPIGLSVVRNLGTQTIKSQLTLRVGGIDLVDATPILDIKPYIAYADAIPQARSGFASDKPGACWDVNFTDSALDALSRYQSTYPNLKAFIISVLQQDPSRPGGHAAKTTNNMEWHFTT